MENAKIWFRKKFFLIPFKGKRVDEVNPYQICAKPQKPAKKIRMFCPKQWFFKGLLTATMKQKFSRRHFWSRKGYCG